MDQSVIAAARARLDIPQQLERLDHYRSVLDLFDEAVQNHPQQAAFSCLGHTLTFAELNRLVDRFAAYLQQCPELEPGDRVAIQLPNLLQYPVALFGVLRAGLVAINTNPLYTPQELEHQLNDAGAKALIVLANVAHTAEHVLPRTRVRVVLVTEVADLHPPLKRWVINKVARYIKRMVPPFQIRNAVPLRRALQAPGEVKRQPVAVDDLAILQYTGGTTGVAKGAMLSHRNLIANTLQGEAMFATYGVQPGREIFVLPLPLYHIYSFILCMVMLSAGNHCVLVPNPRDLPSLVREMRRWRFTGFAGLNTLFVALEQNDGFRSLDFSDLKVTISGGMALATSTAERWQQLTGKPIYEGYGLTETSPVVSINPGNNNQIGTIGLPVPSTEVRVIDDEGQVLPIGEPGELCVRGPQVMLGYWQRSEETRNTIDADGWLRTGDIAVIRDDGYMKIVDRKKDMIVVSGFKVYPGEVEEVLSQHPDVREAAVIGVKGEDSSETVVAVVVPRRDGVTEADIRAFCQKQLTGYKVPRQVLFRTDLPKSAVGKVLRRELRDAIANGK